MPTRNCFRAAVCATLVQFVAAPAAPAADARNAQTTPTKQPAAIPWDHIGAHVGADYHGDGLSMAATEDGARLHCAFQRLDGEATIEGLWLVSTVTNQPADRFCVLATAVGRQVLAARGTVTLSGQGVRFTRAGLAEEYSVSMDGVRQDFVVTEKPVGEGPLKVQLAVSGARVEPAVYGARLVLAKSGRKLAYSRLRATDATGKELPARFAAEPNFTPGTSHSALGLAVVVSDAGAVYPVRIDPTFSDANWISMGGIAGFAGPGGAAGAADLVYAAVVDGSGDLYVGGEFAVADNTIVNHIAKWNGSGWSALGSGMNSNVFALALSGSDLYAGGYFTNAGGTAVNYIAKWDGSSWSALGSGVGGVPARDAPHSGLYVAALAVSGGTLYAGGDFTTAGGTAVNYIAKWDGSSWSALGTGVAAGATNSFNPAYILALAVSGSDLYAGGYFTNASGVLASDIAKWDGNSWSALGLGMNGYVGALAVSGTTLYACGDFTTAGGASANYIAQWNGSSWSALGSGLSGAPTALAVSGSDVYVGGGPGSSHLAVWNGGTWTTLVSSTGPGVSALAVSGSILYAAGGNNWGDTHGKGIARWDGTSWTALSSGLDYKVYALAALGSDLYAGGDFTSAGGSRANGIAKWDGSSWTTLGLGMGGTGNNNIPVTALAVSGTNLYAGGEFTTAGIIAAKNIAKWDGSGWSALGSGVNGVVNALAVSGTNLYAGGNFSSAGGMSALQVAKWDGSSWSALSGSGQYFAPGSGVLALAVSGSDLYAGGGPNGGGSGIRKWDGSSWSVPGLGTDGTVAALAVSAGDVYVAGTFTTAGAIAAMNIAQWDGSNWTALGSGVNGKVSALAVSGTNLYAGGYFTSAGGNGADYIAKWDGTNWTALGSGMNSDVLALAVSGNTLYAAGEFTTAGTNESEYVTRANLLNLPTVSVVRSGANILLAWPTNVTGFTLQSATNLTPPVVWTTNSPAPIVVDGQNTVTIPIFGAPQFFRLSQ